ncbi:MAG: ABC transporter ATP-binding protein [Oscillospiraceae bacterium]|jgi:iron(III) transport system ATP-binding protein|nr:ABC transporter ATP-binding protein [Oscillospiraceae bacterium]
MSVPITFSKVVKKYGANTIIPELTLKVSDGEFFTLLGPSGCGKTTLLRMVAGFNSIESGTIMFGGQVINDMPPAKRNIGMVFQNYAVFPHMTVRQNVAFGLTNRGLSKDEINERVDRILETTRITEYASRMPDRLSGGQQQRVALARAIVIRPNVLLMDEPLSNLDAKLRLEMRNAIRNIHNTMGITTIYVTHDQEEAMAVSDRIAVMDGGVIQQVGVPKAIYQRPANMFVANFIGRSNALDAELLLENGAAKLTFGNGTAVDYGVYLDGGARSQKVRVSVRPEEFIVSKSGEGLSGVIESSVFLGLNTTYFIKLFNGDIIETVEESSIDSILAKGTKVSLRLKLDKINVFTADGKISLTKGGSVNA